jgi:hypothetical protein
MTELSLDLSAATLPAYDGGTLAFGDYRGRRAVLVFGNQRSGKKVPQVASRLHGDPATAGVPVIQVAHLKGVPRAFRRLAQMDIRRGVRGQLDALRELRAERGLPAGDGLLAMGLDWSGEVTARAGYSASDDQPAILLVDERCHAVASASDVDLLLSAVRSFLQPTADR